MAKTTPKVEGKVMDSHIMLVRLSIGCWEGRVQDKEAARKRETEAHAINGAATAGKKLAAGVAEHRAVTLAAAGFRNKWNKITVGWDMGRGGDRAVTPEGMPDLMQTVGDWEREYNGLVKEFLRVWPTVLTQRQFDLGDMYDPKEFPSPQKMARKFYWSFDNSILPNPNDIRLAKGITEDAATILVAKNTESIEAKFKAAANEAAAKLFKVVQAMHETMAIPHGEPGGKFNDSKLDNIIAVAELMPTLNITGDPELAKLAAAAKKLAIKSPDELRGDEVKRKQAAEEAGKLAKSIADAFDVEVDDE